MIPAALFLAALGIGAFIIAVKRGQFDDLDTPALRAVFDDDETPTKPIQSDSQTDNENTKQTPS
jgi:cbb3-type cytochrome oxidase maturation protein